LSLVAILVFLFVSNEMGSAWFLISLSYFSPVNCYVFVGRWWEKLFSKILLQN